jgi:hypothetical protein
MSSRLWPDLSSLSALAQEQNVDIRPVLLRVHTDLFVAAPSRDRATIEAFEALALCFLPVVDEATAAVVARKVAPISDTPQSIIDACANRGGEARRAVADRISRFTIKTARTLDRGLALILAARSDIGPELVDRLSALADDDIDATLVGNRSIKLTGAVLRKLVERGRSRRALATALLAREELSAAEEAALYLHADAGRRAVIRQKLQPLTSLMGTPPARTADADATASLVALAGARDAEGFRSQLALMLGIESGPALLFDAADRHELLALALVAVGIAEEACVRIFLTLEPQIARSVETVFRLTDIVRTVPAGLAAYLVEAILGVPVATRRGGRHVPFSHAGAKPARFAAPARVLPDRSQLQARRRVRP